MRYFISCYTDEGRRKKGNQDSILVQRAGNGREQAVLAVLCDGMGGLDLSLIHISEPTRH